MISNLAIIISTLIVIIIIIFILVDCIECLETKRAPYSLIISLLIALLIAIVYPWGIPAIEVYRGNTTLEITYRDSIPVDSVVVYKKDINKNK